MDRNRRAGLLGSVLLLMLSLGCGTTKMKTATDQLLMSDAVDRSIASIDFRPLARKKVYFDTTYIRPVKGLGFVNSDYIISSLRQQIVGAGCLLQDEREAADVVIEARVGTLGADGYQVTYGLPASNALSTAATLLPETPPVPTIPEISVGRRESTKASAKVAAFAYDRATREPVWQSGVAHSETDARDTWVFGIGPFESGTVRENTRLAGKSISLSNSKRSESPADDSTNRPAVDYLANVQFERGYPIIDGVVQEPESEKTAATGEADEELKQVSFDEITEAKAEP